MMRHFTKIRNKYTMLRTHRVLQDEFPKILDLQLKTSFSIEDNLDYISDSDSSVSLQTIATPKSPSKDAILEHKKQGKIEEGDSRSRSLSLLDYSKLNEMLRRKFPTDDSLTVLDILTGEN
jgi:hypothetical protein